MSEEVLILHGWQNRRPEGHWQRWLADRLEAQGWRVRYPQLPEPDAPVLDDWLAALDAELSGTEPARLTVVAHSLGSMLWMAYAARRAEAGADGVVARRIVLVSPAAPDVLRGIPEIAEFAPVQDGDAARRALTASAVERPVIVASDADPYCPEGTDVRYAIPLGVDFVQVPGGGHLTPDDGYGPFPLVYDVVTR
ncbi:alpha/beta hydrolase [Agromyces sp. H66]|uniref:RBBP9/YdeN family alpha/beta hydrolase n=1 Tax=Agromyces sp. H66 TaxID=2529859 RepID=UPI0010AA3AE2|nr:alpha/beta hydrolase [Agromyces sp. H66]